MTPAIRGTTGIIPLDKFTFLPRYIHGKHRGRNSPFGVFFVSPLHALFISNCSTLCLTRPVSEDKSARLRF